MSPPWGASCRHVPRRPAPPNQPLLPRRPLSDQQSGYDPYPNSIMQGRLVHADIPSDNTTIQNSALGCLSAQIKERAFFGDASHIRTSCNATSDIYQKQHVKAIKMFASLNSP